MLGVPLGVVVQRAILRSALVALDADARRTLVEIDLPLRLDQLAAISAEPDAPPPFAVYTPDGNRAFGSGPLQADTVTLAALRAGTARSSDSELVVATQLVDRNEIVQGVLRIAASRQRPDRRIRTAWLLMLAAATIALAVAWLVARRLARQLTQPLAELGEVAHALATGRDWSPRRTVGMPEIDELSAALHDGADRTTAALARERQFSDDVSHQLRTPLTALRIHLENAAHALPDQPDLAAATHDLQRVDETVNELLEFARGRAGLDSTVDVNDVVAEVVARHRLHTPRTLSTRTGPSAVARASRSALVHALDVLVDNAVRHGAGTVEVRVRLITGGIAIDVADEGSLHDDARAQMFTRGIGADHGIGLALARDLIESSGGRLDATYTDPTTFTITLLAGTDEQH